MSIAISRAVLLCSGLGLLLVALLTALAEPVGAAPRLLITETATAEPPTRTSTSAPATPTSTPVAPTSTSTAIATATATADPSAPTSTPAPPPPPTDEPGDGGGNPEPTSTPPASATATATPAPAPQIADPAITKSANIAEAQVGDVVEFTISVTNPGNAVASGVVVEDSLPAFLALDGVSATRGDVAVSGTTVRVVIGDLAPGEEVVITISARVIASAAPPNNSNIATVSSTSGTDDPSNNTSSASLLVSAPPPASLPNTGGAEAPMLPLLVALGVGLIAASLITRRRQA